MRVTFPADFESLYPSGFGLIDRFIDDHQFESATAIVAAIAKHSQDLGVTDVAGDDLSMILAHYEKSIRYARQISKTAQRVLRLHGEVDSIPTDISGGGSLGRYFCLTQGQWHHGLRFLAMTSDPKLASVAKAELQQHQSDPFFADAMPWIDLADRWDAVAGHLTGRSANQVRLHAIELLTIASVRSIDGNADQNREAMEAKIHSLQDQLPRHQRPAESSELDPAVPAASDPAASDPAASEPADDQSEDFGLRGRILADGEDLGVRLQYQTEVAITPAMLQAIEKQLRRSLASTTLMLNGVFDCDEEQQVRLTLARHPNDRPQILAIDGDVVGIDGDGEAAEISVAAGRHTIAWVVELGESFQPLSLSVRDARTGNQIRIDPPTTKDAAALSSDLTVSVTRISQ